MELYNQHILHVTRELIKHCEKELGIMIWVYNSETKLNHILSHLPLGMSFENIGPDGDIELIRSATRNKQAISGNVDPIKILWQGKPYTISKEVERIMNGCKEGGGFILNTGEMIPRCTPEENMDAFMTVAKKLAEY